MPKDGKLNKAQRDLQETLKEIAFMLDDQVDDNFILFSGLAELCALERSWRYFEQSGDHGALKEIEARQTSLESYLMARLAHELDDTIYRISKSGRASLVG